MIRFLIYSLFLCSAQALAAEVIPYLQAPTPSEITVNWLTDDEGTPTVYYGSDINALDKSVSGSSQYISDSTESFYFHAVRLTDLNADSYYYYRVESGSDVSAIYSFHTQPPLGSHTGIYRVLVLGDHQLRNENRYSTLVTRARAKIEGMYACPIEQAINIVLNVGDQVDIGTPDHYRNVHFAQSEPISPNLPIYTTVGNHETYGTPGINLYNQIFDYTGYSYKGISTGTDEQYAHQEANILFVHVNSEGTVSTQEEWLRQLASATATDSSVDWVISLIHRPYQAEQYVGDISSWFRESGMPILSSSGKHALNIGAHHHLYARGQVRDFPTYHIISGGTAWDQYWGQSTEFDFDDVTKTIANWAWQVIEFNLDERTMRVDSYAEAHPLLGFVYDSVLIDSFSRKLGLPAPDQPQLLNAFDATPVELPLTLESSPYQTSGTEPFYSTQFQVAQNADFSANSLKIDHIQDIEDYYGDTGAPDYTPVDVNSGIDILKYEIPAFGLQNGTYYVRIRQRDSNVEWSPWSEASSFTVTGSSDGDPELAIAKTIYAPEEEIKIDYANGYGLAKDWIGIYLAGQDPSGNTSQAYSYVSAANLRSDTVTFSGLPSGQEYYAGFFTDDSYTEIAPRVSFYVGSAPSVTIDKTNYASGNTVSVSYSGAPGNDKDWIGVYFVSNTPGAIDSTQWAYTPNASGTVDFANLANGFYYLTFFVNDGYLEIADRVYFQVGEAPAIVSLASNHFELDESFPVYFSNGAGTAKDYIGVFNKGAVNLGAAGEELVAYQYVDGQATGSIQFDQALPKGQYFLSLFINDSYTEISNRVYFGVGEAYVPDPEITLPKTDFTYREDIPVSYANGTGLSVDWIGLYKSDVEPGPTPSVAYAYVNADSPANGIVTFTDDLPEGNYYAAFFTNDGYVEIAARVPFSVTGTQEQGAGLFEGQGWAEYPNIYWSDWFGWYYHETNSEWYYQYNSLHWIYPLAGTSTDNLYFWDWEPAFAGWCWTSKTAYPSVWCWGIGTDGDWLDLGDTGI